MVTPSRFSFAFNQLFARLVVSVSKGLDKEPAMFNLKRASLRCTSALLVCSLLSPALANASPKPLDPATAHARILKRGVGNWICVQEVNGVALVGRIVAVNQDSVGLQLQNYPEITPVQYTDIVGLRTGPSRGLILALVGIGVGGSIALALIAHSQFENNKPTLPTAPPGFPN
jgi:hypothetical protein